MGKGPHGPPEGPRGACRYPYGSIPNRSFSPRNRIFFPANIDPNQDLSTFSKNPNSTFDDFRNFPSGIRHFRNSPRNSRLICGLSPGPCGPIWMVTDNRGYQKRPPRPIPIFPVFPFFRVNPSDQLQAGPQPKSFRGKQGVHNQDERYKIETAI